MLRGADEFPDRSDKLAWIFVLTALAPAGVWAVPLLSEGPVARVRGPPAPTRSTDPEPFDEPASAAMASGRGVGTSPEPIVS